MKKWEDTQRQVWSCRLWELPEEDETAQLEEELKGRTLHFAEDALTLQRYIRLTGCSQEEAARRLGRSQSSVANRLRLLKLPENILDQLRESELTERHGRALLRLAKAELQQTALDVFVREKMSASAAEAYVDTLSGGRSGLRCAPLSDVRILFTSLNRDVETLRRCGVDVSFQSQEQEGEWVFTLRVPKGTDRKNSREKT